jgi:hypothetical protein
MSPPTTTFIFVLFAVAFAVWVGVFAYTTLDLNKRVRRLEGLGLEVKP